MRALALATMVALFGLGAMARPAFADDAATVACPPKAMTSLQAGFPSALGIECRTAPQAHKPGAAGHGTPGASAAARAAAAGAGTAVVATIALPDGRLAIVDVDADGAIDRTQYRHSDIGNSSGKGMAIVFWLFALATVGGALFVVTRRNLIAAVMGMVGSFLGIAAIYMLLYAQFLAVVQMLVYAGAIMVLFVFVVMILNRPEDEPVAPSGRAGQALGGVAILYLVGRLILMLIHVQPPNLEVAMAAPRPLPEHCVKWQNYACVATERHDWGSVGAVGSDLFNAGLFPFEAISILLLVAVVGAIAIARPLKTEDDAPAKARTTEGGVA